MYYKSFWSEKEKKYKTYPWDEDAMLWELRRPRREAIHKEFRTWYPQGMWEGALMPIKPWYNEAWDGK